MAFKGEFALGPALEQANKNKAEARKALDLLLEPGRHNLIETIQWIKEAGLLYPAGLFSSLSQVLITPQA